MTDSDTDHEDSHQRRRVSWDAFLRLESDDEWSELEEMRGYNDDYYHEPHNAETCPDCVGDESSCSENEEIDMSVDPVVEEEETVMRITARKSTASTCSLPANHQRRTMPTDGPLQVQRQPRQEETTATNQRENPLVPVKPKPLNNQAIHKPRQPAAALPPPPRAQKRPRFSSTTSTAQRPKPFVAAANQNSKKPKIICIDDSDDDDDDDDEIVFLGTSTAPGVIQLKNRTKKRSVIPNNNNHRNNGNPATHNPQKSNHQLPSQLPQQQSKEKANYEVKKPSSSLFNPNNNASAPSGKPYADHQKPPPPSKPYNTNQKTPPTQPTPVSTTIQQPSLPPSPRRVSTSSTITQASSTTFLATNENAGTHNYSERHQPRKEPPTRNDDSTPLATRTRNSTSDPKILVRQHQTHNKTNSGRWTDEERERLRIALTRESDWESVVRFVRTREFPAIRSYAPRTYPQLCDELRQRMHSKNKGILAQTPPTRGSDPTTLTVLGQTQEALGVNQTNVSVNPYQTPPPSAPKTHEPPVQELLETYRQVKIPATMDVAKMNSAAASTTRTETETQQSLPNAEHCSNDDSSGGPLEEPKEGAETIGRTTVTAAKPASHELSTTAPSLENKDALAQPEMGQKCSTQQTAETTENPSEAEAKPMQCSPRHNDELQRHEQTAQVQQQDMTEDKEMPSTNSNLHDGNVEQVQQPLTEDRELHTTNSKHHQVEEQVQQQQQASQEQQQMRKDREIISTTSNEREGTEEAKQQSSKEQLSLVRENQETQSLSRHCERAEQAHQSPSKEQQPVMDPTEKKPSDRSYDTEGACRATEGRNQDPTMQQEQKDKEQQPLREGPLLAPERNQDPTQQEEQMDQEQQPSQQEQQQKQPSFPLETTTSPNQEPGMALTFSPSDNDVVVALVGTDHQYRLPGNLKCFRLIYQALPKFLAPRVSEDTKDQLVLQVYTAVVTAGGRFVKAAENLALAKHDALQAIKAMFVSMGVTKTRQSLEKKNPETNATQPTLLEVSTWEERLSQLEAYKNENGHLNVPAALGQKYYKLGNWLVQQRFLYKRGLLCKERLADLCRLGAHGFDADSTTTASNDDMNIGPADTPGSRSTSHTPTGNDDQSIQTDTVSTVTGAALSQPPIQTLLVALPSPLTEGCSAIKPATNQIRPGSKSNPKGSYPKEKFYTWEGRLAQLEEWKKEHGHLNVPVRPDCHLGQWLSAQRSLYRNGTIRKDRLEDLRQLGTFGFGDAFVEAANKERNSTDVKIPPQEQRDPTSPQLRLYTWEDRMSQLEAFKKEHGHSKVPTTPGKPNYKLGQWIAYQRQLYRNCTIRTERLAELRRLGAHGFGSDAGSPQLRHYTREERISQLEAFKKEYGHLRIPGTYGKPNYKLGQWINYQRQAYRNGTIREELLADLRRLGAYNFGDAAEVDVPTSDSTTVGTIDNPEANDPEHTPTRNVEQTMQTHTGTGTGAGTGTIAASFGPAVYPEEPLALTDTCFQRRNHTWEERLRQLEAFQKENGHLKVPVTASNPDYKLGKWIDNQRQSYRKGTIHEELLAGLRRLGAHGFGSDAGATSTNNDDYISSVDTSGARSTADTASTSDCIEVGMTDNHEANDTEDTPTSNAVQTKQTGTGTGITAASVRPPLDPQEPLALSGTCFHRRRYTWEERLDQLEAFKKENGHLKFPKTPGMPDSNLGKWIDNQRQSYRKATIRKELLAGLRRLGANGFGSNDVRTRRNFTWEERLGQLEAFKKENGHSRVSEMPGKPDYKLGKWIANQRQFYRNGTIRKELLAGLRRLGAHGFGPNDGGPATVGTPKANSTSLTPASNASQQIQTSSGIATSSQFPQFSPHAESHSMGSANNDQVSKSNPNPTPTYARPKLYSWEQRFRQLEEWKKEHGHLQVPTSHGKQDYRLGQWIAYQRRLYQNGSICEEHLDDLRRLGASGFGADSGADAASTMTRENGEDDPVTVGTKRTSLSPTNHVDQATLPCSGTATDATESQPPIQPQQLHFSSPQVEGPARGGATNHHKKKGSRSVPRATNLPHKLYTWEDRLVQLEDWKKEHGHLNIPRKQQNYDLGAWLLAQRSLYLRGIIRKERLADLHRLGVPGFGIPEVDATAKAYQPSNATESPGTSSRARTPATREDQSMTSTCRTTTAPASEHPLQPQQLFNSASSQTQGHSDTGNSSRDRTGPRTTNQWGTCYTWEERLAQLGEFLSSNGHLDVPTKQGEPDYSLGLWLARQKRLYQSGTLRKERLADLCRLGVFRDLDPSMENVAPTAPSLSPQSQQATTAPAARECTTMGFNEKKRKRQDSLEDPSNISSATRRSKRGQQPKKFYDCEDFDFGAMKQAGTGSLSQPTASVPESAQTTPDLTSRQQESSPRDTSGGEVSTASKSPTIIIDISETTEEPAAPELPAPSQAPPSPRASQPTTAETMKEQPSASHATPQGRPQSSLQMTNIPDKDLTGRDILLSESPRTNLGRGNDIYRQTIAKLQKEHQELLQDKKNVVVFAQRFVQELRQRGIRFLTQDYGAETWNDIGEERMIERVCASLSTGNELPAADSTIGVI
ncbi:helicase [Seminavis robusta]|uniref:Helicase n=1 Tax=Seminavis robusta TaxID=568900 RepID=A0A9N8DEZ9_9STRA|nr:helicase [Seminavis robusta]|eukprot:Sro62_g035390.1 helicase (2553) ;mRNA; f:69879-77778